VRARLHRPPGAHLDVLLALALLGVVEAGVWLQQDVPGGKPLSAAALGVAALALAGRRRVPLAAAAAVAGGFALPALVAWESTQGGTGFVVLLAAAYSVARHAEARPAGAGWLLLAAATAAHSLLFPGDHNLETATWQVSVVTVGWLVGRGFRVRAAREEELRARAARLERDREARARAAVLDERGRIARELHDVVAHNVSVIAVQTGAALEVLGSDSDAARDPLLAVERTARETLAELRILLGVMRASAGDDGLRPQPDLAALPALVEQVGEAGVHVDLEIEGDVDAVEAGLALSAYRIVQEALTNVLKHAGAGSAQVRVRRRERALEVEVLDDGRARGDGREGGHGLLGMRERVALYGGELEAGPREGGGFVVRATLPLDRAAP
jgi:signal transduction histidine kinase